MDPSDPQTSLDASFWVMILLQTLGSVDVKSGPRKMPSPKVYVTALIVWAGLKMAADTRFARGAAVAGWVIVLTALVLGPSGSKLMSFFTTVANTYGVSNQTASVTPSPNTTPSGGGLIA